jgi:hypothetical protein
MAKIFTYAKIWREEEHVLAFARHSACGKFLASGVNNDNGAIPLLNKAYP